jgi:hypothetical protein
MRYVIEASVFAGLVGPFDSRDAAEQWLADWLRDNPPDGIVESSVVPLHPPSPNAGRRYHTAARCST